jgi:DNA-binding NtrC family response regulator
MLRQLFEQVLRQQGYQTETAASEAEAERFRQQQGLAHLALVIADIQLSADPHAREGYALYERWTAVHPTLRFLLMSGNPGSQALPVIQAGVVRFLAKPFAIRDLLDAVQALVGRP